MDVNPADLRNAIGFLTAGLILAVLGARYAKAEGGAIIIALLFAPVLIFLAASGRLSEVKGLGLEAKFQQKARESIQPKAESMRPLAVDSKEIKASETVRRAFAIGTEVVLLVADESSQAITASRVFGFAEQIYPGLLQGNFEGLVVLDPAERVLGFFPRSYFLDLLRIEISQTIRGKRSRFEQERVAEQLEQTQLWDVVATPRIRAEADAIKTTVRATSTNAQALSVLQSARLPTAVVVDDAGRYAGIVRREDIVAALVTSLAGAGRE